MHIFLVYGGKTAEHRVSINSAASFLRGVSFDQHSVTLVYITENGQWLKGPHLNSLPKMEDDMELKLTGKETLSFEELKQENAIVFPLLHGPNGEDGTVQGLLEVLDVPYVGPGVVPCACGMDKIISKDLFSKAGIPQTAYFPVLIKEWQQEKQVVIEKCKKELSYPVYIKPANMGSSIGITEANSSEELEAGFDKAFRYDRRVVVEQGIQGRELNTAIIGNSELEVSIVGELVKEDEYGFYDYEDKYIKRSAKQQYPAEITEEEKNLLQEYSLRGFESIDGNGMGRVDLFLTDDGKVYLNEINMIPGFSSQSIFAMLWKNSGLAYADLIDELIRLGVERHDFKKQTEKQTVSE